jgi:hypothetical protein
MNPPFSITRFIGTPRNAKALYLSAGLVIFGWVGGALPWWLAVVALCFVSAVRKAEREVNRYDAWAAEWQAMGQKRLCGCGHPECTDGPAFTRAATPKARIRRRKASSPWRGVIVAALSLLVIPVFIAAPGTGNGTGKTLTLLWLVVALYLVFKLVRRRRVSKGAGIVNAGASKNSAAVDVVEWALPPASSSPSRSDAMRSLPDYCARLIGSH